MGWIKGGLKRRLSEGEWKRKEGLGKCIYIRHEGCTFMLSKTRLFSVSPTSSSMGVCSR